jgi:predicted dehydrogenase
MLDKEKLDSVFVVVRPDNAFYVASDVLERGIALFVEKPPALTAFQTARLAEIARKSGAISFVGFNRRYAPALVEARRRVEANGPIDHFVVTFSKFGGPSKEPYYGGVASILVYDAIHAVDMLRWLGGEPEAVAAVTRESHKDQDAKYVALARFAGGRTGFLNCTWNSGTRTLTAELHGGCSVAFVDIEEGLRFHSAGSPPERVSARDLAGSDAIHRVRGYFAEDRAFIDSVKSGSAAPNDLADAARTMELAERLYHAGF